MEVVNDKALDLLPLTPPDAAALIGRTRIARLLKAWRNVPAANEEAIIDVLLRISQLAMDLPEIESLDLNPLLADEQGVIAVDGRVELRLSAP